MAKLREVATAAELMKLVEESDILPPAQLRKAQAIAAETGSCRLLARRLVAQNIVTRWQASQLLVGWTKLRLGKYILRSQVGRGNFGRVFLAQHAQLAREVAIKTLSRRFTQYPEMVDRFLADAREVAALDHRNIIHIFDVDSCDDQFYMVMEHVRGFDLQHQVEQTGPLAIETAAHYLSQAADGLSHSHQRGVLHRDVQPTNLMIDDKGVVRIVGWGIGRLAGLRRKLDTSTQAPLDPSGSGYLPPEQLGGHEHFDARSDIYALGCTGYYLLTGQTPAPASAADSGPAAPRAPAATDRVDIAELRVDLPNEFAAVIRRMMAGDPADRYSSATEVMQALRPWTQQHLETVPPPRSPADQSDSDSFDWTPGTQCAVRQVTRRPSKVSEPSDSTARRGWSGIGRLPRWSLLAAIAIVALTVVGLASAMIYWLSKPDAAASWNVPRGQESGATSPPRWRKRDQKGILGPARADAPPSRDAPKPTVPEAPPVAVPPPVVPASAPPADMGSSATEPNAAAPAPTPSENGAAKPPSPPAPEPAPGAPPPATNPPPPSEPPATPEPPANPWRDLPAAVDLPAIISESGTPAAAEPLDVGPIATPWTDACDVTLLGRTTAGARGGHFELAPQPAGPGPGWQVSLVDEKSAETAARVIANLRIEQNQLRFQWDAAAPEIEGAAQLSNCVLRLTSGTQTHDLRLRKPLHAEPLQIDLRKTSAVARAKVAAPPDPKQVRVQITAVDEPLPRSYTLNPAEPIGVTSDAKLQVSLGPDAESQVLLLELTPELKTVFLLKCEAYFRVAPDAKPEVLAPKRVAAVELRVAQNQDLANQVAQQKRGIVTATAPTDPLFKNRQDEMNKADAQLAECTKMTQNMVALAEIRTAVAAGAAIHFRVFFLADDCQVELLRSGPDSP